MSWLPPHCSPSIVFRDDEVCLVVHDGDGALVTPRATVSLRPDLDAILWLKVASCAWACVNAEPATGPKPKRSLLWRALHWGER